MFIFSYDHDQVPRKLRVGVPIENHANTIYTRAMYEKFYDELFESGRFAITSKISESEYLVTDTKQDTEEATTQFTLTLQGTSKITCQCGLFEHMGMLCRHALKVINPFKNSIIWHQTRSNLSIKISKYIIIALPKIGRYLYTLTGRRYPLET